MAKKVVNVGVVIRLVTEELLYDVKNYSFVEGDIIGGNDVGHIRHQVQDICEGGNADRVTRVLNMAHAECVEMLYPHTKTAIRDGYVAENVLLKPAVYVIELSLPAGMAQSSVSFLEKQIHEYMVCRILEDWMGIVYPEAKSVWVEKLKRARDRVRNALVWRRGRIRRSVSPF